MSSKQEFHPWLRLLAVACVFAFVACLVIASSNDGKGGALAAETTEVVQQQTVAAEEGNAEDASPNTLEETESSFTELQKALDAARQSETPDEAVERTTAVLERLAEQQSQRRSMSAELQSQIRNAVNAAQDVARQADEEDPAWKTEFQEKLQPAQDAMDRAVAHEQEAQGFAAAVILGIFALFFLFLIFMAAPELGCLIVLLLFIAGLACLLLM